ncbi:putative LRR receptor-like serine/threonine-protein kinase [Senna tora]|uniref:non-specific serine/threonine protein kinase n=1 Tax=Senna tora TaxID=362788 RepID=A0A834TPQ2_9FABA|nr:putative LRR receptor-like serine/threonine-protein kinase [Senna tora]
MAFAPISILIFYVALLWLQHMRVSSALSRNNESDHLALLKFHESISNDPHQILSSWNASNHFCNWHGVTCSHKHQRVTELKLQGYGLRGTVSPHVGNLSFLRNLGLGSNYFHGEIPAELGRLFRLKNLSLWDNALTGEIPINLTSCIELRYLRLSENGFIGIIPNGLGSLRKLEMLHLDSNNLTGYIPASIWNLSSLKVLSVGYNNLEGSIPEEINQLENLIILAIHANKFSGAFPSSLYNMSSLTIISAANNQLNVTQLPHNMFSTLFNLQQFGIAGNQIAGFIPTSISNASSLQLFDIGGNYFVGKVPSLGNLKDLSLLDLELNNLGGSSNSDLDFITSLENCSQLEILSLASNNFGGILHNSIANLSTQLMYLYLGGNQLHGAIPASLGKYLNLIGLSLESNKFIGTIPTSFGKFHKLQILVLQGNQLSGEIPTCLGNLSQLVEIRISENKLQGKIPPIFGKMKHLSSLDLSKNNLSGVIPLQILSLSSLSKLLNLSHNSLNGSLPIEIGTLKALGTFDISENDLSGLQNISVLEYVNVSFNMLDGEVPKEGVFKNASAISVVGYGSFGSVYRGRIESEDKFVAIKVLNLQKKGGGKSFDFECNALKNIRHRNLVKILTCCSSIDYKGQEFKALVFEYMSNGSLDEWLHSLAESVDQPRTLDLDRRFNILYDVASALHYLHCECEQPIVHCDLKPRNILLDDDMVAHVSDFGLARLLSTFNGVPQKQSSTTGIKGTIGYAPPVLEMLTGRRPTDDIFKDGHDLHSYVRTACPNKLLEIVDSALLRKQTQQPSTAVAKEIIMEELIPMHPNEEKAIFSLFGIGLACSMESPKERLNMMDVTRELNQITKVFHSRQ